MCVVDHDVPRLMRNIFGLYTLYKSQNSLPLKVNFIRKVKQVVSVQCHFLIRKKKLKLKILTASLSLIYKKPRRSIAQNIVAGRTNNINSINKYKSVNNLLKSLITLFFFFIFFLS